MRERSKAGGRLRSFGLRLAIEDRQAVEERSVTTRNVANNSLPQNQATFCR